MRRRIFAVGFAISTVVASIAIVRAAEPEAAKIDAKIDPKADQCLKTMSTYLAGLKTYSFQVDEFFDDVLDDGQKIQLGNQRHLSVSRPNRMFSEGEGDTKHSHFYYDGKTASVVDLGHKTYASVKVPDTIDAMLEDLHERFDTHQTLSDFLFSDPYKVFTENVQTGSYVGSHFVGKIKCHHLAFHQKLIDWQIWIEDGEQPLPRKFVITFTAQTNQPQYTAIIHRWDVNPKLGDEVFEFHPPQGFREVEFLSRHAEPQSSAKPAGT